MAQALAVPEALLLEGELRNTKTVHLRQKLPTTSPTTAPNLQVNLNVHMCEDTPATSEHKEGC